MVGIGRAIEIGEVAGDAGRAAQIVGPRGAEGGVVALRALQRRVRTRQRKARIVVVKGGIGPGNHVMAGVAGLREAGSNVIRDGAPQSLRAGPVCRVAGVASRVGGGKGVIVPDVALVAIRDDARRSHLVVPRQSPTR